MCDLPGSGIVPVSPALAGGFFSIEPWGKPLEMDLYVSALRLSGNIHWEAWRIFSASKAFRLYKCSPSESYLECACSEKYQLNGKPSLQNYEGLLPNAARPTLSCCSPWEASLQTRESSGPYDHDRAEYWANREVVLINHKGKELGFSAAWLERSGLALKWW